MVNPSCSPVVATLAVRTRPQRLSSTSMAIPGARDGVPPLAITHDDPFDAAGGVVGCWLKGNILTSRASSVVLATYHPPLPRITMPAQHVSPEHRSRALHRRRRSPAVCPRVLDDALRNRLQALVMARVSQRSDGVPGSYAGKTAGTIRPAAADTVCLHALRWCAGSAGDGGASSTCTTGHECAAYHPTCGRLCPLIPRSAPRIGRRRACHPLVAPSHPRRSSWTAACAVGRTAAIVSAGGTDSLGTYQLPMRGAFMLAFMLELSSPTRPHSPSTLVAIPAKPPRVGQAVESLAICREIGALKAPLARRMKALLALERAWVSYISNPSTVEEYDPEGQGMPIVNIDQDIEAGPRQSAVYLEDRFKTADELVKKKRRLGKFKLTGAAFQIAVQVGSLCIH
ncbi:hypothetical protein BJ912DRAFT_1063428 [Pholiota molesta]|nr:hypothetical protein BJ912DRAFT_1063428 [Pholiota molesta]